jgi:dCMP deaminase
MSSTRPDWDTYFMQMAQTVATRATCDRKHVGAVIVRDRVVISTGYNGAMAGMQHCDEVGHLMEDNHCVRVVHSEMNAICQAAKHGARTDGATIYVTASPCWPCFKALVNAGIRKIVYGEFYRDDRIFEAAQQLGIELQHLPLS